MESEQVISEKLWGRSWCSPPLIVACLIIGNAALIVAIIIVGIYFGKEVSYRSEKEFLLELQRIYDTAICSLFGVAMFCTITSSVGLAVQLKVMKDTVDHNTQQVNQQRHEYEKSVRRFARDAFLVRKYYENGRATLKPAEVLSVQQAVSKYNEMKEERNVSVAIREISKHLTMLNKMKATTDQPAEKQLDSKFVETQRLRTQGESSEMLKGSEVGERSGRVDLTQRSVKGEKSLVIAEKTKRSVIKPTTIAAAVTFEHKKSIPSQKSRNFQSLSARTTSQISRTTQAEGTQSLSYHTSQRDAHQTSTESESDAKMARLSKSSRTALSMHDQMQGQKEGERNDKG
ncbi:unnamed protein product [Litomosoides sigmodontis]|uniref:Uncharacterized protein n=1 Tax=Litomosoides sigmodontis TaxID=42156 RepID=A0A3P6TFI0_LITSI|nr:unnamed protein product [Litomosoides sigmodontis]